MRSSCSTTLAFLLLVATDLLIVRCMTFAYARNSPVMFGDEYAPATPVLIAFGVSAGLFVLLTLFWRGRTPDSARATPRDIRTGLIVAAMINIVGAMLCEYGTNDWPLAEFSLDLANAAPILVFIDSVILIVMFVRSESFAFRSILIRLLAAILLIAGRLAILHCAGMEISLPIPEFGVS